jgi:hypothetical protein
MNKQPLGLAFLSLLGIGLVICALAILWDNANKPGLPAHAQKNWPHKTSLQRHLDFSTLVMFVYPHCDCSEASLSELNQIMKKVDNRLNVFIVFVTPAGKPAFWKNTGLWSSARLIPNTQIILDQGALEADRFGAQTSGQVLLYDPQGQLIFSGGITRARGHAGDNAGKSAIISYINNHQLAIQSAPVFGCALKSW